MTVKYANHEAMRQIRKSQYEDLKQPFPLAWSKMSGLSPHEKPLVIPREEREVCLMKDIDLLPELGFIKCTALFYMDGFAEVLLSTLGKPSDEKISLIMDNDLTNSPLGIRNESIVRIFFEKGLTVPDRTLKYKDLFALLTDHLSWVENLD